MYVDNYKESVFRKRISDLEDTLPAIGAPIKDASP